MEINIRVATIDDKKVLEYLLQKTDLNRDGIDGENTHFLIAEEVKELTKNIVAIAGIEKKGNYGLLRSLVIETKMWGANAGVDFVTSVIHFARELKFKHLYLLTLSNSKEFFRQLGFTEVGLDEVPAKITESNHFRKTYHDQVAIMKNAEK